MDAELALAAHVQQSLTPHSLIWKNLAVEAYYSPARTIGGDFGVVSRKAMILSALFYPTFPDMASVRR